MSVSISNETATQVRLGRRPSPVGLTDRAISKVAELLAEENNPDLFLRVAVRPGGCSGFSYDMYFDAEQADDDIVRTFGTVKVAVDPSSAEMLKGASLDWKDGLNEAGFHISNPNASRTCGCGSSFS